VRASLLLFRIREVMDAMVFLGYQPSLYRVVTLSLVGESKLGCENMTNGQECNTHCYDS